MNKKSGTVDSFTPPSFTKGWLVKGADRVAGFCNIVLHRGTLSSAIKSFEILDYKRLHFMKLKKQR